MALDEETWLRAKAWVLWKATFELCQIADQNSHAAFVQKRMIEDVLFKKPKDADYSRGLIMGAELWYADIAVTEDLVTTCLQNQFSSLMPIISLECIGEGWDNKVFLLNEKIIFRYN
jgi:hypothetical protein